MLQPLTVYAVYWRPNINVCLQINLLKVHRMRNGDMCVQYEFEGENSDFSKMWIHLSLRLFAWSRWRDKTGVGICACVKTHVCHKITSLRRPMLTSCWANRCQLRFPTKNFPIQLLKYTNAICSATLLMIFKHIRRHAGTADSPPRGQHLTSPYCVDLVALGLDTKE